MIPWVDKGPNALAWFVLVIRGCKQHFQAHFNSPPPCILPSSPSKTKKIISKCP